MVFKTFKLRPTVQYNTIYNHLFCRILFKIVICHATLINYLKIYFVKLTSGGLDKSLGKLLYSKVSQPQKNKKRLQTNKKQTICIENI